ncbi:hypothetical protein [Chitinibacter sp. S2-10]|uniref:hypothetical protein n=1 Tax=Chitinibacter sp. S2-10 TaxID=3373597 RepID=UPI0039774EC7
MNKQAAIDARIAELIAVIEVSYWQSDPAQLRACTALLDLCLAHQHRQLGYAYLLHGRSLMVYGEPDQAQKILERGVTWCRRKKDAEHYSLGLLWLGLQLYKLNDLPKALTLWLKSLALASEQSNLDLVIEIYLNLGTLYQRLDLPEECHAILMSGFSLAEAIDNKRLLAKSGIFLSNLLLSGQQYSSGMAIIARSERDVILHADLTWVAELCRNKAICLWRQGKVEDADICFESAICLAKKFDLSWIYISVSIAYSEFLIDQNQQMLAIRVLDAAAPYLEKYRDDELRRQWSWARYSSAKSLKMFDAALTALKECQHLQETEVEKRSLYEAREKLKTRLAKIYPTLRHDFRQFERMVNASITQMSIKQLLQFKKSCEETLGVGRIIEISVATENHPMLEQRAVLIVSEYCSAKDCWVKVGNGCYYIFPGGDASALFDFALRIIQAIEAPPWPKFQAISLKAKARILQVNQGIVEQIDRIIQRGGHDAG